MVKIFLSHQQKDSSAATLIAARLRAHEIESYLDVVDSKLSTPVEELGDYIRREMGRCTQLLAVSENTRTSEWVPWEIGVATEKNFPLATYLGDRSSPPEFLTKWPCLRSLSDLDEYARTSKSVDLTFRSKRAYMAEELARRDSTIEFYKTLRARLGR